MTYGRKLEDLELLESLSEIHQWEVNWRKELMVDYDALVLTDSNQIIQWVSKGFEAMTGYSPELAIGNTPKFLQGKDTSSKTRRRINEHLQYLERSTETITNYRKNGSIYECHLSIIPLLNRENEPTHFIAIENEIKVN